MEMDGHHIRQTSDRPTSVIPETIGQFIGKYDKNGRKIYEGDIVILDGPNSKYVFEVIFDKKTAGFKMKGRYCHVVTDLECEVIGNIHDNPEFNNQISN